MKITLKIVILALALTALGSAQRFVSTHGGPPPVCLPNDGPCPH